MKTSIKKNQLIITALAVMIAIAGYLKYSDSMIDSEKLAAASTTGESVIGQEEIEMDISAEDIYASTGITEEVTDEVAEFVSMIEESGSDAYIAAVRAFHNPSPIKVKFDRAIKEFE